MPLIEKRNEVKNAPRGGKGDVAFEHLLTPDEMGKSSSLTARLTLPAGAAIGYHMHSGDGELYYILSGEGLYVENGKAQTVRAGDSLFCPDGSSHSIENTGNTELTMIAVVFNS